MIRRQKCNWGCVNRVIALYICGVYMLGNVFSGKLSELVFRRSVNKFNIFMYVLKFNQVVLYWPINYSREVRKGRVLPVLNGPLYPSLYKLAEKKRNRK